MLKVLISSNFDSKNAYVRSIVNELKFKCEITCKIDAFWLADEMFDIVHIQWPEELFYWRKIELDDLDKFKARLEWWERRGTTIVVTRHNELPHRKNYLDSDLYKLAYGFARGVVHLGEYSRESFIYNHGLNVTINHPSYIEDYREIKQGKARSELALPIDGVMYLSLGQIRSREEQDFLIESFISYRKRNKESFLVICNLVNSARSISLKRYPFKKIFNEIIFQIRKLFLKRYGILIDKSFIEPHDLAVYLNAANFVVVPRLDTLNSGVIFLAYTYGKPVIGPNIGNMKDVLSFTGNPTFTPGVTNELLDAFQTVYEIGGALSIANRNYADTYCKPEDIANQHLAFYLRLRESHCE